MGEQFNHLIIEHLRCSLGKRVLLGGFMPLASSATPSE
jgi:hypothetical protein